MNTKSHLLRSAGLLIALALAGPVSADIITWNNPAGGDWDAPANWSPQQVPGANDSAVVNGTASFTIQLTGSQSVSELVLGNPNATLRLEGNATTGNSTLTVASGFENRGTIELTSQDITTWAYLDVASGTLLNASGGVIRVLQGAGGLRYLWAELDNRGTLAVERDVDLYRVGGNHRNSGQVSLATGTRLNVTSGDWTHQSGGSITGTGTINLNSTLILEADFTVSSFGMEGSSLTVNGPGRFVLPTGPVFTLRNGWTFNADIANDRDLLVDGTVAINGAFGVAAGRTLRLEGNATTGNSTLTVASGFENRGTIELTSQDITTWAYLDVASGTLLNASGGVIRVLQGAGGLRYLWAELDNRGTLAVERDVDLYRVGGNHRNSGLIEVTAGTLTVSGNSFENRGEVRVLAGATFGPITGALVNAADGLFTGTGTLNLSGAVVTNGGTVAPGTSPGTLGVTGDYPQSAGGTLAMEIGGFTPGSQHDRLAVSGVAQLGGTIRAILVNGFSPTKDDAFTVLTYASRSGSFATVQSAEPERIAWRIQYGATSAQLIVANTAPTLATIINQTINEETLLSHTATATDRDSPAQIVTYSLDTAPTGMTIDSASGLINWTPTEAQGPGVYNVTVRATDNGLPVLTHTTSFTVTVNEVNVAPQLVLPAPQTVDEQVQLAFIVDATDADLPANTLTYEMLSGPAGATFDPTTREFRWTPTETQGPDSFTASFRVTDNNPDAVNTQQLSATGDVTITVNEVNLAPVLAVVPDATIHAGTTYTASLSATDSDLPANALTYSLLSGPTSATVSAAGVVNWSAPVTAAGTVADFTVSVTDNGLPTRSADRSFQVNVTGLLEILSSVRTGGQLEVTWRAIPGRTYRLVSSDILPATEWTPFPGDVEAVSATATKTISIEPLPGGKYLRVELVEE